MANPQLEDGYTQIANEILESLMRIQLAPNEWSVLICIIRRTYGFRKKVDYIANFQIMQCTGLRKDTVSRALRRLKAQGLITKIGKVVGFNKDWESWQNCQLRPLRKLAELPTKLAELPTKVDSPLVTQKKKETIQKKEEEEENTSFEEYVNSLRTDQRFTGLNLDEEVEKMKLYWSEGGRKLKRPKLAFLNWLLKAVSIKDSGNHNRRARAKTLPSEAELANGWRIRG